MYFLVFKIKNMTFICCLDMYSPSVPEQSTALADQLFLTLSVGSGLSKTRLPAIASCSLNSHSITLFFSYESLSPCIILVAKPHSCPTLFFAEPEKKKKKKIAKYRTHKRTD